MNCRKVLMLLSAVLIAAATRAQLVPGYLTDPTQGGKKEEKKANATKIPAEWLRPYISTYYVEPVISPEKELTLKFFVTDWENSHVRYGDRSHKFSVVVRYSSDDCKTWNEKWLYGVEGGDGKISLGFLPLGDYTLGIQCIEEATELPSHVVWHEFRVRSKSAAEKTKVVTAAELAKYGVKEDGGRGQLVLVDAGDYESLKGAERDAHFAKVVKRAAEEGASKVAARGYTIFAAATKKGFPVTLAWKSAQVVYGAAYDQNAVEEESLKNSDGLQKLLDDAKVGGYGKVVFPKGTYRVSAARTLYVPGGMTLDLGGATLKMNRFTGAKACIAGMRNAHDAHLINGTLEGDYYEHDYENSPNNSEWPMGVDFTGDCRYSSFENLTIKNITGYGGGNGTEAHDHTFGKTVSFSGNIYSPGTINPRNGELIAGKKNTFTSDFRDITSFQNKYLSVSKYLGYQGIRTLTWNYRAAFYDAQKRFISAEEAFQYRVVLIPKNAAFMRITIVEESLEKAQKCELSAQLFKVPWNCAFKRIRFERCRAVGLAPAAMRNMLIERCEFTQSGENLAKCAFDAEDGWDLMQDVTIRDNRFFNNPNNELLACAGHNFVIEGNEASIYLWDRVNSPCVRHNKTRNPGFRCATRNRTMHGRYYSNEYQDGIRLGLADKATDWNIAVTGIFQGTQEKPFNVVSSPTGQFRNSTFKGGVKVTGDNFKSCRFEDASFIMTFQNFSFKEMFFDRCTFQHCNRTGTFENCELTNCNISSSGQGDIRFVDSKLTGTVYDITYWTKPLRISAKGCKIELPPERKAFVRTPAYSIAKLNFEKNQFKGGKDSAIVEIYDARAQPTDGENGAINFSENSLDAGYRHLLLINAHASKDSKKRIAIEAGKNTFKAGGKVVNKEQKSAAWSLIEK